MAATSRPYPVMTAFGPGTPPRRPRILVVRPDHLGDVVVTLPAVAALRSAVPGAVVTYAASPPAAEACRRCPHLDHVIAVAFPGPGRAWGAFADAELRSAVAALGGPYDLAVLARPDDPASGTLCAAAGVPVRIGFATPQTLPFLTRALPPPAPGLSVAETTGRLLAAALAELGAPGALPPLPARDGTIVPTAADRAEAAAVLAEAGVPDPEVVLHPGSGWPVKNWPPARWGLVARRLRGRLRFPALVAGTARERPLVEQAVRASRGTAVGIAGRLSVGGLAALHARARVVAGVDSGALHLAAAVGTPTVALYGPGSPAFAPPPPRHRVVRLGLACSPCGRLEAPPCGRILHPACVTGVPADAIAEAVLAALG